MLNKPFWDIVRAELFNSLTQKQVDGIYHVDRGWKRYGDGDMRKFAYVLATTYHETAKTMQPITEYGSREYLKAKKYWPYVGRGYVQLTWKANYADWSKRLGIDLVKTPDLALDAELAGQILVQGMMLGTFTGKKLPDYIGASKCDFVEARRIVNGTDKASLIARHAEKFLAALKAGADVDVPPPPDVEPSDQNRETGNNAPAPKKSGGLFALIVDILAAIFGGRK